MEIEADNITTKPQGNWVPISKALVSALPHNELRPYTDLEAMFSLTVDYDTDKLVTVRGYAALWRWSRGKVERFLEGIGVEIQYPENPGKDTNQGGPLASHLRATNGPPNFIDSKWLRNKASHQRATDEPPAGHTINPNPKPNPKAKKHSVKTSDFLLPEWVPADAWNGFVEMRVKNKEPMTDRAAELVIKKLAKFKEQGHDPGAVLDESTERNWKSVFPLKVTPSAQLQSERPAFNL